MRAAGPRAAACAIRPAPPRDTAGATDTRFAGSLPACARKANTAMSRARLLKAGDEQGPCVMSDDIKFTRALYDCPFPLVMPLDEGFTRNIKTFAPDRATLVVAESPEIRNCSVRLKPLSECLIT